MEESTSLEDVSQIPVDGYEVIDPRERNRHYTILKLIDITPLIDEYFMPKVKKYKKSGYDIGSWDGFKRLKWELQEMLPLDFPKGSRLADALKQKPAGMEVRLNGNRLFRNDLGGEILDNNRGEIKEVGNIKFRYAIETNWNAIHPFNSRGLKMRLKNVGVGERTYFDLGIRGRTWSRLHWISGEVHIYEGLDESIAVDRDSFTWSILYEEFRDFFRSRLYEIAYEIENIAYPEKKINELISSSVGPVRDQVEHYLEMLPEDYKIIRKSTKTSQYMEPVHFDKANREVIIVEDHEAFKELITIAGEKISVSYSKWNYLESDFPVCRIVRDGHFEINMDHPLLKKTKYSEVFLKLNLILLLARHEAKNQIDMYEYIIKKMTEEFGS